MFEDINKFLFDKGLPYRLNATEDFYESYNARVVRYKFERADGKKFESGEWKAVRKCLDDLGLNGVYLGKDGESVTDRGETGAYIRNVVYGRKVNFGNRLYQLPGFVNKALQGTGYRLTVADCFGGKITYQFLREDGSELKGSDL